MTKKTTPLRCSVCGQFGHWKDAHVDWVAVTILGGDPSL